MILDEPTAALGVAQTAEVLDLIERLRERGLGVILISHNMADVRRSPTGSWCCASAATTAMFRVGDATNEEIIAAITGATDNVGRRARAARRGAREDRR